MSSRGLYGRWKYGRGPASTYSFEVGIVACLVQSTDASRSRGNKISTAFELNSSQRDQQSALVTNRVTEIL
ncbi:hypothetical protein HYDPIDRAFT_115884 [Hydnomerulius pinastri MD-312]|uniref:Uncharacterized protein n=1 Tax=Hydnomerulius pinastri MD-312 TaxID=994086 RepID=A0A0C9WBR0_9AGAM|nr:hypothetical protein HYDPIDRAFT_115884 [Hydnomerulius pinastri MD-312]